MANESGRGSSVLYDWDWSAVFEELLERHRRDDGSRWGPKSIERASGGYVLYQYVSHLRAGRISQPSFARILAISEAMGIPLEAWPEAARRIERIQNEEPDLQ